MRAPICARSPPCIGSWPNTPSSSSGAGSPVTRPGWCRSWSRPAPGQVYSWDITKLAGPAKGVYYDAYVMIDIYSRYIVGVRVHPHESGLLAADMMAQVFGLHGTPQVVHADRGTSMTSKTVAQLLADLEVTRSYSRPRVSNDNPYSEAWFKTLKYAPTFPERFGSLADAQQFMNAFVDGYNHHHRHTGIGLHTPADVHYGHAAAVAAERKATLAHARRTAPRTFRHRPQSQDHQPDPTQPGSTNRSSKPPPKF